MTWKILFGRKYNEPHSFIQGSLELTFSELYLPNVALWNQYKYIAVNIFSRRILIISCKMLIITRISNETYINHICNIISKRCNILTTRTTIPDKLFGTK